MITSEAGLRQDLTMVFTILDWMSAFEAHLEQSGRALKTIAAYLQDVRVFGAWFEGENAQPLMPDLVTRVDLRAWRQHSLHVERVAGSTWNRRRASLAVFCEWARQAGFLTYDPSEEIRGVAVQKSAPRWLPKPAMNRFLRQVELQVNGAKTQAWKTQALRDQAMVALMLYAGLREGEVAGLDLVDVTLGERSGKVRILGKGEKERKVPLNQEARRALVLWIAVRGGQAGPLFTGKSGGQVSTRLIQRRVAEIGQAAGVDVTPHQLRHTFAKRAIDAGQPLSTVQELLGHERTETTAVYTRPGWDDLERAVESL